MDLSNIPANVQYAWPHPSKQFFYVASSNGGPGVVGDKHLANYFRIDPASGALQPHGQPQSLPSRPIHISLDGSEEVVLQAGRSGCAEGIRLQQGGDNKPGVHSSRHRFGLRAAVSRLPSDTGPGSLFRSSARTSFMFTNSNLMPASTAIRCSSRTPWPIPAISAPSSSPAWV